MPGLLSPGQKGKSGSQSGPSRLTIADQARQDRIDAERGVSRSSNSDNAAIADMEKQFGGGSSADDRLDQLKQEADPKTSDLSAGDASRLGGESRSSAKNLRGATNQGVVDALKDGRQTEKAAAGALGSAQKATGIDTNRPLSEADKLKHSTPQERAGLPGKPGGAGGGATGKFKNNKTALRATVSVVVLMVSIVMFILTIPLKLMHIATTLLHHNGKNEEHISTKAEHRVIERLFGLRYYNDNGTRNSTGNGFLKDKMVNMRIEKFNKLLAKDGVSVRMDGKKFVGLEKDGKLITDDFRDKSFLEARKGVGGIVADRISPRTYLGHVLYTKAMRFHFGVSFAFWHAEKSKDLLKDVAEKIRRNPGDENNLRASGQTEDPNKQTTPSSSDNGGDVSDAVRAAEDEFTKTNDQKLAIKAGTKAFRAKALKAAGFTGIAMMYCMIQQMFQDATTKAYAERAHELARAGNLLSTMSDQMTTGELNLDDYGKWMERFDGDDSADPKTEESAKDFTQSAAWRRTQGETPNTDVKNYAGYTPDLSEAANPDGSVFSGLVGAMNDIFQMPGTQGVCKVLNSWFGWVVMGVELTLALGDGESSTIAAKAAQGAILVFAMQKIIPVALEASANLAVTGTEDAVQLINNGDAGLNLSMKDYSRSMGDRVGTDAEANTITAEANADDAAIAQAKGWTYRTFALDNTNSLASKVIEHTPTSPARAIAAIRSNITNLAANLSFIIFRPKTVTAAAIDNGPDPYHFRQYVTTDKEIDSIDPIGAEEFLNQEVDAGGTKTTRLKMLGDMTAYTPANGDDTNNQDLLHCFVNNFRIPGVDKDDICLGLGVLTNNDKEPAVNPGKHEVVDKIYCDANKACGLAWENKIANYCDMKNPTKVCSYTTATDFDTYRLYLKYVFLTRGLEGETTDTDPFQGTGQPAADTGAGGISVPAGKCTLPLQHYPGLGPGFGVRGAHWSLGYHTGQDFDASIGTPIYAVCDGTLNDGVVYGTYPAYGNATELKFSNGDAVLYAHQSRRIPGFHNGMTVKAGDLIGYTGDTGNVTGPHLHFEYRPGANRVLSSAKDPVAWLKSIGVDVPASK